MGSGFVPGDPNRFKGSTLYPRGHNLLFCRVWGYRHSFGISGLGFWGLGFRQFGVYGLVRTFRILATSEAQEIWVSVLLGATALTSSPPLASPEPMNPKPEARHTRV